MFHFSSMEECDSTEFENKIPELLDRSKHFVYWSTSLYPPFYNKDGVRKAIENAVSRNVSISFLLSEDIDVRKTMDEVVWLRELWVEGKIGIRQTKERNLPHVIIEDNLHVRLEKYHPQKMTGGKNKIITYCPVLARNQAFEFSNLWRNAKDIGQNEKEPTEHRIERKC